MADNAGEDPPVFNQTDDAFNMTGTEEPEAELAIPAAFLPIIAMFVIAVVFYLIKMSVDYFDARMPKNEDEVRFEQKLPVEAMAFYEKKREEYDAGLIVKKEVMDALMKRAMADMACAQRLQEEAKSLRQAELMGKLPTSLREAFMKARDEVDKEIMYIKAEAEDLEPGFGEKIVQIADNTIKVSKNENQKRQEDAMAAQIEAQLPKLKESLKNNPQAPKMTEDQMRQYIRQQMQQQQQQRAQIQGFVEHMRKQGKTKEEIMLELKKRGVNVNISNGPPPQGQGQVAPGSPAQRKNM